VKRTIKYFLFALTLCFCHFISLGQKNKIDSLQKLLQTAEYDSTRLRLYLALGEECDVKDNLKYALPAVELADKLLSQTTHDKERKKLLKQKVHAYYYCEVFYAQKGEISRALEYVQKDLSIYQEIKDTANIVNKILDFSYYYSGTGNFPKALEYGQKGLSVSKDMKYKKGIAISLLRMGVMYSDQGDTAQALENYQKGLSIGYGLKDKNYIAGIFISMGNLHSKLHHTAKAIECFQKAISLFEEMKDKRGILWATNCTGDMYQENNDFSNALANYQKSLSMAEELKDKYWISTLLNNMGNIYLQQAGSINVAKRFSDSLYGLSLDYNNKALKINEELKDENRIAWSYSCLANTYLKQKNFKKAKDYSDRSIALIKKYITGNTRDAELLASQIDSANGNGNDAYEHYKQYIILRDKLNSEEVRKAAAQEKFQSEYEKQKAIDKAEQEKQAAVAAEESRREKVIRYSVISGLVAVLVFLVFVYRSLRITRKQKQIIEIKNKETEHQKHIIEEKNKDITDSINYAQRIQRALLASDELLNQCLTPSPSPQGEGSFASDYFILFKPKDIVSGDFYWATFKPTSSGKDGEGAFFLAVCDSTGHGVPGAFMSLLNISFLNEAINEEELIHPNEIFNHVRQRLIENISSDGAKDGMDGILISIKSQVPDPKSQGSNQIEIAYAAAHNAPVLVRNGELLELEADKMPVGLGDKKDSFKLYSIIPPSGGGGALYLYTDGFADQFGGPKGKKFKYKQLNEKLLSISHHPLATQKELLEQTFEDWKGNLEQVDDLLVIGIRV